MEIAFTSCYGLKDIVFPDSIQHIGDSAFDGCGFINVSIPVNLNSIGRGVFAGCVHLKEIFADPKSQYFATKNGVLFNKEMTTLIMYPTGKRGGYIIPDGVQIIYADAFLMCQGLTSVSIPDSVTWIDNWAFAITGLISANIPDSVVTLGYGAFAGASLKSVVLSNSLKYIAIDAFSGTDITDVTIPSSVLFLEKNAFQGCRKLINVFFEGNAPYVYDGVFDYTADGASAYITNEAKGFSPVGKLWNGLIVRHIVSGCIITFDPNGGTVDTPTVQIGPDGRVSALPTPNRRGYTFDGWFLQQTGGKRIDLSYIHAVDTTLYAHWTIAGGTSGGNGDSSNSGSGGGSGGAILAPTPSPMPSPTPSPMPSPMPSLTPTPTSTPTQVLSPGHDKNLKNPQSTRRPASIHKPINDMADIGPDHWAAAYIEALVARGVISGYPTPDGTFVFMPENEITRAELMKLIVVALGLEQIDDFDGSAFVDWNDAPEWAKPYIAALVEMKIVNGSLEGYDLLILANNNITREEMISMVIRALGVNATGVSVSVPVTVTVPASVPAGAATDAAAAVDADAAADTGAAADATAAVDADAAADTPDIDDVAEWALNDTSFAIKNAMINLDIDGNVNPRANDRRDEAAMLIYKLLEYLNI